MKTINYISLFLGCSDIAADVAIIEMYVGSHNDHINLKSISDVQQLMPDHSHRITIWFKLSITDFEIITDFEGSRV